MTERTFLAPENCCLQIIDVQESLMAKIDGADHVAATTGFMIECARILEIPIFGNTQYKKGLGPYVASIESLVGDLPIFDKVEFNSFENKETAKFIGDLPEKVDTMILVGVETHICIYQTAMGLLDRGFSVWVVSDGVSSRSEVMHLQGLERIKSLGGVVGPAEMLVYELLGKAGTPKFKEVLPHIIKRG
ncbi:isochorismatase family protein [Desulfomarina sp.]